MIITTKIKMDLLHAKSLPAVDVVQSDNCSRELEFSFFNGKDMFHIPENTNVVVRFRKFDGKGGAYDTLPNGTKAWHVHANTLTVTLAPQVMTTPGDVDLSISLSCGDKQISTFPVSLRVHPVAKANTRRSENYFYVTGFLPTPKTAQVGQYLQVSGVDTNGNVTAISAVDFTIKEPEPVPAFPRLCGKKIIYDGDSICESRTGSNANNGGGYAKIIADMVGGTYENKAISGAALTSTPDGAEYHSIVDSLTELPTDGDLYCFEGGYNDYWRDVAIGTCDEADYDGSLDTTTICGAMERIFRYCLSVLVGRPVCFVIVHKCVDTQNVNGLGKTFKDYRDAMVQVCEKYSIPFYDAFTKSGLNGWNANQSNAYLTGGTTGAGDGCHPNEQGYKRYYVPQLISLFESMMPSSVIQSDPGEEPEVKIENLIDTVGYTDGVRLSASAGTTKDAEEYTTTGFIEVSAAGDVYQTSGVVFDADTYAQSILCDYNADQSLNYGSYLKQSESPRSLVGYDIVWDGNGNLTITTTADSVGHFFRISGYGTGANLLMTKS